MLFIYRYERHSYISKKITKKDPPKKKRILFVECNLILLTTL